MYNNYNVDAKKARKFAYSRFVGELVSIADRADKLLLKFAGEVEKIERPLEYYHIFAGEDYLDKIRSRRWYLSGPYGIGIQAQWAVCRSLQLVKQYLSDTPAVLDYWGNRKEYARVLTLYKLAQLTARPYKYFIDWAMKTCEWAWDGECVDVMIYAAENGCLLYDRDDLRYTHLLISREMKRTDGVYNDYEIDNYPIDPPPLPYNTKHQQQLHLRFDAHNIKGDKFTASEINSFIKSQQHN